MKKHIRAAVVGLLAVAVAVPFVSPAQAADGLCNSGYTCGYSSRDYGGTLYGTAKDRSDWGLAGFADKADSVSTNGADCKYTDHYDTWHPWDNAPIGKLFTMYSRQLMGRNYRDASLHNGAGYNSSGADIRDRIEATVFWGC